MPGVPRISVEDAFISGLSCAVCGQSDLYVQHLPSYPDFVTCRACGAAFVVEDTGERVMYGKVPDGYPDTSEFALRQWVWLEAVERRAAAERPAPAIASPEAALRSSVATEPEADIEPEEEGEGPAEGEPTPGQRHRVLIRGDRVRMPVNVCAHCQKAPAPDRLPVDGTLPRPGGEANRRNTTFQVPLCRDCSRRAKSRTTEQSGSRLMALLTGALVGLVLVVVVLATGIVPFAASLALGLLMLGIIWFIGFGLTAGILLSRAGRQAPSLDANYVRTTLRVGADPSAPQTSFEWRNRHTALNFYRANGPAAVAEPSVVHEPAV